MSSTNSPSGDSNPTDDWEEVSAKKHRFQFDANIDRGCGRIIKVDRETLDVISERSFNFSYELWQARIELDPNEYLIRPFMRILRHDEDNYREGPVVHIGRYIHSRPSRMHELYNKCLDYLREETPVITNIRETVRVMLSDRYHRRLEKIVAFGIGSLQDWNARQREISAIQLAALVVIREELRVPCFAQEPNYTETDKNYLRDFHGIRVLEDPEGFAEVNSRTLVFHLGGPPGVEDEVTKNGCPGAILTDFNEGRLPRKLNEGWESRTREFPPHSEDYDQSDDDLEEQFIDHEERYCRMLGWYDQQRIFGEVSSLNNPMLHWRWVGKPNRRIWQRGTQSEDEEEFKRVDEDDFDDQISWEASELPLVQEETMEVHANGSMNGSVNGYANGHANGVVNGEMNGETSGEEMGYED